MVGGASPPSENETDSSHFKSLSTSLGSFWTDCGLVGESAFSFFPLATFSYGMPSSAVLSNVFLMNFI